jgi:glycosyltransferase involved in cell wall biosynthesis
MILAPTKSVIDVFKRAGFLHAKLAPYPISHIAKNSFSNPVNFSKVLVAGAARQDKGFTNVVDLIEHLATIKAEIPFYIQSSSEHLNKSEVKRRDIARLKQVKYPTLTICEKTLNESDYLNLFPGSICLQPYDAKDFSDRVSGVTLDSLMAGSPIITTANTWIARCVQRFEAGIILESKTPDEMASALNNIISNYDFYATNAKKASNILQSENDASELLSSLLN